MGKLNYLVSRIFRMNYKQFFSKIDDMHRVSGKSRGRLFLDVVWCGVRYSAGYMDYALFEFYLLDSAKRKTYLTRGQNNALVKKINHAEDARVFTKKARFLEAFKPFVGREWLDFTAVDAEQFNRWLEGRDAIFVKPMSGCGGSGVALLKDETLRAPDLYTRLKKDGVGVVETPLVQHDEMSTLNASSINTLRIATMVGDDGRVEVLYTFVRMGRGAAVDNFNAGGMTAKVDSITGQVITNAVDKSGQLYAHHPVTGVALKGFQIPLWQEAVALAKTAALQFPRVRYVGWDVAVTPSGPALVEGNEYPGHDLPQMSIFLTDRVGLLPMFKKYL